MNKDDFIREFRLLNGEIRSLKAKISSLKRQYIDECCPYKVGDKVKIVTPNCHGESIEEFGYVKHIGVSDGRFIPDCFACKKDGTPCARNKVSILFNSVITKVIDENDMRLEDYTTDQLRAELARRNKLAREAARKNNENKPKYTAIEGIVKRVLNDKGPLSRKKWEVEVPEDFANEHKIKQILTYGLLGGAFTKDTAPKVGDKVILRCRLTKACPRFTQGQARIISIANG